MKILIASSNSGKIDEFKSILKDFEVIPQKHLNIEDVEETGTTFSENALLKANNGFLNSGLPSIGDDSGLIVPLLNGDPGLYSARYAGEHASDQDNRDKLSKELKKLNVQQTPASFICVIAVVNDQDLSKSLICEGRVDGSITVESSGHGGFGYDPMFIPQNFKQTFAEIDSALKHKISHRGQALAVLQENLSKII